MADEIDINIGTFDLDSANNIAVEDINVSVAKSIQEFDLPKFHGSVIPIGKRKTLSVRIRGTITGSNYDSLRSKLDGLKAAFESSSEQNLALDDDRILKVQYRNFAYSYKTLRTFADFSVDLVASDPFWYAAATTTNDQNPATSGLAYVVNNPGNAKARVQITGSNSAGSITDNFKIENKTTGEILQYRGTVLTAKKLIINNRLDITKQKFGGSSLYLDGNVSYITTPNHADWAFGAGDFTIDSWVYFNSLSTNGTIYSKRAAGGNLDNFVFAQVGTDILVAASSNGTTFDILNSVSFGASLVTGQWYHIAVVRSGNNFYGFLNGVKVNLGSSAAAILANSQNVRIGGDSDASWVNGYIDEFRVSNTPRWTEGFTPPTSQHVVDANTLFLLHFAGAHDAVTFVETVKNKVITAVGSARIYAEGVKDLSVQNDYVDDVKNFEGDFITLDPGDNTIVFTGAASTRVQLVFRPAWC